MVMRPALTSDCDTTIIGAGPYGLAAAAHLKNRGVETQVFGEPMSFWRRHMPKGMFLRSPWGATTISDPNQTYSLDAYIAARRLPRTEPLLLDIFVGYGEWFQERAVANIDHRIVARIEAMPTGFRVTTNDGVAVKTRQAVIATGLANQSFRPEVFNALPRTLVSHSSEHHSFEGFRGQRVAVVGRGQSACESAVLLKEAGAEVELICRRPIHWLSCGDTASETAPAWHTTVRTKLSELLATPSGVGPFPLNWMIEYPILVHRLPASARSVFNIASLRAGAAGWLLPRFHGIKVIAGVEVEQSIETDAGIRLTFGRQSASYDHVLLGTGYQIDIANLGILAPDLLARIACYGGAPVLNAAFESSVRGLYFVGASAVASLGPLMRFIAGTRFAACRVADAIAPRGIAGRSPRGATESLAA